MDVVQIPYTNNIKRDGVVNLCIIQPYTSDLTSSSVSFKSAHTRTVTMSTADHLVLNLEGSRMTFVLGSQQVRDALVYFVKVTHNRRGGLKTIAALRVLVDHEEGIFTCSVDKRNKISFQLNLTAEHSDGSILIIVI